MDTDAMRSLFASNANALQYCVEIGLLVEKDGMYSSSRLNIEIAFRMEKSEKAKKSANKRWRAEAKKPKDANAMPTHSERNTNAMLGEERRGEDIIKEKPKRNDDEKRETMSDEETEKQFMPIAVEFSDEHYADKTVKQLHDLRGERRDTVYKKMRVVINCMKGKRLGLAKKIFHEIAGMINDFGAMEKNLDAKELANRREFHKQESGQAYVHEELDTEAF